MPLPRICHGSAPIAGVEFLIQFILKWSKTQQPHIACCSKISF